MAKSDVLVRWKADTQNYDANMAKAKSTLNGFVQSNLTAGGVMKQLASTMVATAGSVASVTAAVHALTGAIKSNIETARGFEKSMSQLSSLTGMVGGDLEKLKEYAIELGSTTTLSASQVADAFKMIGSQQPQLLSSGEALKKVTEYAIRLSEAAGIDLSTAAQTLSTSINQMGGDSNNAERYINVLAAASQKGAGDIAWLGEAITKSAAIAKAAGTDYEELVANLEQLAKAGFDASTSGTALRSIIMNLEKQANSEFKPSVVGLTQAFENLGKANLDIAGYQGIVGKMFAAQAMALANAAKEARKMTDEITGTSTATSQAKTNVDNLDGSLKSLSSAWEGLNLHINDNNKGLREIVDRTTDAVRVTDKLYTNLKNLTGPLGWIFNKVVDFVKYPLESLTKKLTIINYILSKFNNLIDNNNGSSSNSEVGLYKNNPVLNSIMGRSSQYGSPIPETLKPTQTDQTFDIDTASISELQKKLKELRKERDEAIDDDIRADYNDQIKTIQDRIKALKGGGTTGKKDTIHEGGISFGKGMDGLTDVTIQTYESMASLRQKLAEYQRALDNATNAADEMAARQGIADTQWQMSDTGRAAAKLGWDRADLEAVYKEMQDAIGELEPLKIEASVDIDSNAIKRTAKDASNVTTAFQAAAISADALAVALRNFDDPTMRIVSIIAEAIANVASGAGAAIAKAGQESASWIDYLAASTSVTAQMITTIAEIRSATKYAQGGIIKGNSYSGDNILAQGPSGLIGLNAGEVVLTKAMQGNLASQLSESGGGGGGVAMRPYVDSERIYLGMENMLTRRGKGEIVTTSMLRKLKLI